MAVAPVNPAPEENLGLETGFGQYPLAINLVRLVFDRRPGRGHCSLKE
jgi:hypothetical protein